MSRTEELKKLQQRMDNARKDYISSYQEYLILRDAYTAKRDAYNAKLVDTLMDDGQVLESGPEEKPTESSTPPPPAKEKPKAPEQPSPPKQKEQGEDSDFPKYSQNVKASEAKSVIRSMAEEGGATEVILSFLKGVEGEVPPEDRKTVLDVAETHIGKKLIDPFRESPDQEEEEKAEEKPTESSTPPPPPSKPTPPEKPTSPSKPKEEKPEKTSSSTNGQRVELPEGVSRPKGAPECFGNSEVYDVDSKKCMMCIFDFECEKAQEAIANE